MTTVGLIAGAGRFPLEFARSARAAGHRVVAAAVAGHAAPELEREVDALTWVRLGELGKAAAALREGGAQGVVLLGAVAKARFLRDARLDGAGLKVLARVALRGDDDLLRGVARWLEEQGLPVIDPLPYLADRLAPEGVLGARAPDEAEWADVRQAMALARAVGQLDLGQTVVVKAGVTLAVEALEGTDACIRRAGALADGGVVAKALKPQQDRRFDLPAVGPDTVDVMREARARVLALEAGATLILDREELVRRADAAGIAVVGVRA